MLKFKQLLPTPDQLWLTPDEFLKLPLCPSSLWKIVYGEVEKVYCCGEALLWAAKEEVTFIVVHELHFPRKWVNNNILEKNIHKSNAYYR